MMLRLAGWRRRADRGQAGVPGPAGGPVRSGGDQPGMGGLFQAAAASGQLVIGLRVTGQQAGWILAAGDLG